MSSRVFNTVRAAPKRPTPTVARFKSTHAGTTSPSSGTASRSSPLRETVVGDASVPPLPWAQYLDIRKGKRRWETAATIPLAILGFAGGIVYFGNQDIDPTKPIFGIDPMMFYGFATVACSGVGALAGPSLGAAGWRFTHRHAMQLIEAREREFHKRIVNNRVDPSRQSATNPVPDFYGEKIGSISEYRQWLRDQNKFRRKARWLAEDEV